MKVLVIEDEKSLARLIEVELTLQGKEVEVRYDGKSGLIAALEGGVDLVLLDWMLPDVEGIEVCRILRSKGQYSAPSSTIDIYSLVDFDTEVLEVWNGRFEN